MYLDFRFNNKIDAKSWCCVYEFR